MPKIKLSAMVTDMKGKSGGSVFSKNKGGNYFRNNPSGGGQKSAKWDKQKGNFSSTSTDWRALTVEQQDAWKSAVDNYPTTNAFGDPRIPSGYELFMRLNSNLKAGGFPQVVTPAVPRATPSTGQIDVVFPSEWQFNPRACYLNYVPNNLDAEVTTAQKDYLTDFSMNAEFTFSWRMQLAKQQKFPLQPNRVYEIADLRDADNYGYQMYVVYSAGLGSRFKVVLTDSGGTKTYLYTLDVDLFSEARFFCLFHLGGDLNNLRLTVDSTTYVPTITNTGLPADVVSDKKWRFLKIDPDQACCYTLSDFRYYDFRVSDEAIEMLRWGYVFDTEVILIDFIGVEAGELVNYGSGGSLQNFTRLGVADLSPFIVPVSYFLVPMYKIVFENEGLPNLYAQIYASPPNSVGRGNSVSNFKNVLVSEWNTEVEFLVYNQIRSLYKNVPAGSQISFMIDILDQTTGNKVEFKKRPKSEIRFKAGSELADKVN